MAEFAMPGDAAEPIGRSVAGMLGYLAQVLDREDRLETGTGNWLADFMAEDDARAEAVQQGVLRALRLAADPTNFAILQSLGAGVGVPTVALAESTGLNKLSVSERVADLASAGLASKVPEANQVAGTDAGAALVALVRRAVQIGASALGEKS